MNVAVNSIIFLIIFCENFLKVSCFCVPQIRSHGLMHDGDKFNKEIANFSIERRTKENCEQILFVKFEIDWKWKEEKENFEEFSMEIDTFQAAFYAYFEDLFKAFNKSPINLILEYVGVNVLQGSSRLTRIKTNLRCKSTLSIVSSFLENDCDKTLRILLENFKIRQLLLYFYDRSVSPEVSFDYNNHIQFELDESTKDDLYFDEEADTIAAGSNDEHITTHPPQYFTPNYILPLKSSESKSNESFLQKSLEAIYDDVKDDKMSNPKHNLNSLFIEHIKPVKKYQLEYFIRAHLMFPWILAFQRKNTIEYKEFSSKFKHYIEKLYAANPLVPETSIVCYVDRINKNFNVRNHKMIHSMPNEILLTFFMLPVGFVIPSEDMRLDNGNLFDKMFENFQVAELLKIFKEKRVVKFSVDGDGFVHFDGNINNTDRSSTSAQTREMNYSKIKDDYDYAFNDDEDDDYDINNMDYATGPNYYYTTTEKNDNPSQSTSKIPKVSQEPTDITPRLPIFTINADTAKLKYTGYRESYTVGCTNCRINVYGNNDVNRPQNGLEKEFDISIEQHNAYDGVVDVGNSFSNETSSNTTIHQNLKDEFASNFTQLPEIEDQIPKVEIINLSFSNENESAETDEILSTDETNSDSVEFPENNVHEEPETVIEETERMLEINSNNSKEKSTNSAYEFRGSEDDLPMWQYISNTYKENGLDILNLKIVDEQKCDNCPLHIKSNNSNNNADEISITDVIKYTNELSTEENSKFLTTEKQPVLFGTSNSELNDPLLSEIYIYDEPQHSLTFINDYDTPGGAPTHDNYVMINKARGLSQNLTFGVFLCFVNFVISY